MESHKIKILLADDHPVARGGIKSLMAYSDQVEVVGEACNGKEALHFVRRNKPDVLITDISMSELNGIELAQIISTNHPETKVLILSMFEEKEFIVKGYEAGALGYLPKNSNENELIEAIRVVHSGEKFLTAKVSDILAQSMLAQSEDSKRDYRLTKRETEILSMLVNGMSNKQIAAELFVSNRTVDTHRTNIMKKLRVNNAADLVRISLSENLCPA